MDADTQSGGRAVPGAAASRPSESRAIEAASRSPRLKWAVRLAASAVVLAVLLTVLPADEVWSAIRAMPLHLWPLGVVVYLACHLIGVAKWRVLVNAAGADLGFRPAAHAYYWGLFGNTFLPSIVGGDLVRAGVAMRQVRSKSGLILGSLVDRLLDVAGLGLLAGAGVLLSPRALDPESQRIFLLFTGAFAAVVLAGAAILLMPARHAPFRVRRKLVRVRLALRATAARPGAVAAAFLAGLLLQSLLVVLNWWLGRAIGIDIPIVVWFFVWPLAKIAGLLPLTQGGIGVREAAQAALFAPFGVSAVRAVATGLVFQAVILSGGLLSGGIALVLRRDGAGVENKDSVRLPRGT